MKTVELALGKVESVAASLIETMCETMILPDRHSAAWMMLLTFLCLQSGRTSQSANDAEEMGDYLAKLMMSGKADELGITLDDFIIKQEYPVAMPLSVSSQAASNLLDLDACFLRSKTGVGFFASDNPVVFFNSQRCHIEGRGHIGLGSKGIQIFYPLSPTVCLYLYDASVYKQPTNTDVRIVSVEDQVKINLLIALWAKEVIFIPGESAVESAEILHEGLRRYYGWTRSVRAESDRIENHDGTQSSLLISYRPHPPAELSLSFSKIKRGLNSYDQGVRGHNPPPVLNQDPNVRRFSVSAAVGKRAQISGLDLKKLVRAASFS